MNWSWKTWKSCSGVPSEIPGSPETKLGVAVSKEPVFCRARESFPILMVEVILNAKRSM